jgi:exosortase/archaeosortase family protein
MTKEITRPGKSRNDGLKEFLMKNKAIIRFIGILALMIIPAMIFENIARNNHAIKESIVTSPIIYYLSKWLIMASSKVLVFLGYHTEVIYSSTCYQYSVFLLRIHGGGEVFIGISCLGLGLIGVYSGLIIAFPGKARRKLVFIPAGIILIIILNIIRISLLTIMLYYYPIQKNLPQNFTDFIILHHHYLFNLFVLLIIFGILIVFIEYFSEFADRKKKDTED